MLRAGRRLRARLFEVKRLDSPHGHVRVAIVVPKYGFTIVRRNKLKRRLRELVRVHVLTRPASCDLIVRASRQTYDATFDQLRGEMTLVASEM